MNWRDYESLLTKNVYKKHFAFLPTKCEGDTIVWFSSYYKQYKIWYTDVFSDYNGIDEGGHRDFIGCITEEEFVVRKLAETL